MQIQFFDSFPRRRLEPVLHSAFQGAKRIDAAIAFVTRGGTAALHEFLAHNPPTAARLLASVRFPTDLTELFRLADKMPGRVYIHTGFKSPKEYNADRGQFHSKLVLIEYAGNDRCIVVGSHNWTENALQGHNLEAGIIIRCLEGEAIVAEARRHIEACIDEEGTELFDPNRLRFYQAVQRDLQPTFSGPASEPFPGFVGDDALVIHAEADENTGLLSPLRLFIPVESWIPARFFTDKQPVILFVYPRGTLFVDGPPRATPHTFRGAVTMTNLVADAPVGERLADLEIRDLRKPQLATLPDRTVPQAAGEEHQVVIKLNGEATTELPVFHSAGEAPRLRWSVEYHDVEPEDEEFADDVGKGQTDQSEEAPQQAVFSVPTHLALRTIIRLPNRHLYPKDLQQRLIGALWALNFLDGSAVPDIEFMEPDAGRFLNPFIYLVSHRLLIGSLREIQIQPNLF